ncbi:MAG: type VI secretion system baseplate subunit TssG [Polyangiales bacterium]
MAHSSRPALDTLSTVRRPLSELLDGRALHLSFYALMRKLETLYREAPRFGETSDPALEPVRLGQDPSLAFHGSALTAIHDGDAQKPPQLRFSFFGAHGPHGPLPTHLTQYVDDQRRHRGDATWVGFLDIFHQRMVSLFYRAWANAQPTVSRDRPDNDRFARYLGALIGQSTSLTPQPLGELDELSLFAAQHFTGQTRHPEGLSKVLQLCFGVKVEVEEFVGQWLDIPPAYAWTVPSSSSPHTTGAIGVLGESTRVGTQVWDRQSKFRVIVGPVPLADYKRFLPGGEHLTRLIQLVQRYVGLEINWDIRLILQERDRRAAILGTVGLLGQTTNLGQSDGGAMSFEDLMIDPVDHMPPPGNGGHHV